MKVVVQDVRGAEEGRQLGPNSQGPRTFASADKGGLSRRLWSYLSIKKPKRIPDQPQGFPARLDIVIG